jgi:hypothetical protein
MESERKMVGADIAGTEKVIALLTDLSQEFLRLREQLGRIEKKLAGGTEPEERWWSPHEIARVVERADLTIREWARKGQIPSRKDSRGRRWVSDKVAQLIFRYQGLPPAEGLAA